MKKQLKEKQLQKRMATAKKGAVLAATALILSNSPVVVMTAFAEGQEDASIQQSVVQQEKQAVEVQSSIDQSIYGDLLKDKMNPQAWSYLYYNWQIEQSTLKNPSENTKVTWQNYSADPNLLVAKTLLSGSSLATAYIEKETNTNRLRLLEKASTVNGGHSSIARYQEPQVIPGRTYTLSQNISVGILSGTSNVGPSAVSFVVVDDNKNLVLGKGVTGGTSFTKTEQNFKSTSKNIRVGMRLGHGSSDAGRTLYYSDTDNTMNVTMKYADQWKQVDALFTSLDHTELAEGVTRDAISQAKAMVNSIPNNADATEMNAALATAETLFEKKTTDAVNSLLNNGQLAPGISQEEINKAQELINQLPDGNKKQELQNQLNQAQELLTNQQNAQTAVDNLFDNGQLKPTISQTDLDQAQQLVDKLPEGEKKQELQGKLDQAKEQFKQLQAAIQAAQTAVDNLFNNGQLKPTVSQTDLDQAQQLVNQLPEGEKKQTLQAQLDQAKEQFNQQQAAIQAAQTAVDKLFKANGQLAPNVTQEMIEEAQELINKVPDGNKKQALQAKLDKAQKLYNQLVLAEVTVMVNGWFTDASHTALKEGVTTDDIEKAVELLGQLPESSETDKLAQTISVAQKLLNKYTSNVEAKKVVDSLFTDSTYTKLAEKTTKEDIDNAKALVAKLTDVTVRNELTNLINKAYDLWENKSFTITKVDSYKEGETKYVSGTYTGNNAAYIRLIVNDKKETLTPLKSSAEGTFQYYRTGLKATDKVIVVIYNANYEELAQKEVTITPGEPTKIASVYPYVEGKDNWITGKYEGLAPAYIGVTVNGVKKPSVSFKGTADDTFKYYLPGLKGTDKVEVTLFNDAYQEVARQAVQVTAVEKVEITSIDTYKPGVSNWITGKVSGTSAKYMQLMVNGQKTGLVSSEELAHGTFSYYKAGLKSTDKVEIILYDKNYQEVARKDVPIEGNTPAKITSVDPYEVGKSEWITGEVTGETAAYIRVVVNGEKKALLNYKNTDGTFKYYLAGLKSTDKVEVEIFDSEFNKLSQMAVPFK
ncbi:toxin Cry1Ac domain D-VI-related protein [Enterococcus faecalis]|uniref:toxin Cry1Ac domain D-VI-related protein n=1 Tax=Enterococcus faecalis TaxID=1351 RepID=UPI002DBB7B44|nr:toxin Cry1Ac domain D-VI-related protein [Enterococcus faecalis]MEB8146544.1 toxin Cry1Ac domain D-VI-related protein [Enterococcus faecalis]